jgi:hypothetical protein
MFYIKDINEDPILRKNEIEILSATKGAKYSYPVNELEKNSNFAQHLVRGNSKKHEKKAIGVDLKLSDDEVQWASDRLVRWTGGKLDRSEIPELVEKIRKSGYSIVMFE